MVNVARLRFDSLVFYMFDIIQMLHISKVMCGDQFVQLQRLAKGHQKCVALYKLSYASLCDVVSLVLLKS